MLSKTGISLAVKVKETRFIMLSYEMRREKSKRERSKEVQRDRDGDDEEEEHGPINKKFVNKFSDLVMFYFLK